MDLENLSIILVYGSMATYAIAMIGFSIDLFGLSSAEHRVRRRAVGIGMSTTWLAAFLHLGALITRTAAAGRVPWANMYEFTLTFLFLVVVTFLALTLKHDMRFLGSLITLSILLGLGLATSVLYVKAEGVEPILDDYWLIIHVSIATLSTALLHIGAVFAILQLAQHSAEKKTGGPTPQVVENIRTRKHDHHRRVRSVSLNDSADSHTPSVMLLETQDGHEEGSGEHSLQSPFLRLMSNLPPAAKLEVWAYRVIGVGFITWTFTIIAGAIWAEHAWGRPWGWDPKETWSFVVWVIYAAYLHARATVGWTAEKFAYFILIGFLAVLANFYLVNLFIPGNHSYAF